MIKVMCKFGNSTCKFFERGNINCVLCLKELNTENENLKAENKKFNQIVEFYKQEAENFYAENERLKEENEKLKNILHDDFKNKFRTSLSR